MARREWHALSKGRNAERVHWGGSLRAGRQGAIHCVMPLGKDRAIPGEACLVASPLQTR
ncbi:MAG: hypothetical protein KZQ86_20585 [Candidatus Thiodiazotropha sp. (ex Lucinoma kastoroae)]|nr:hypothetical protein [Candidatus Thiodiazotropha sp. (ex Lucinoma kastoroae)]